jgi:hypothetical protein
MDTFEWRPELVKYTGIHKRMVGVQILIYFVYGSEIQPFFQEHSVYV